MADEKLLAILKKGTRPWNELRKKNLDIKSPDLSRANLQDAYLRPDRGQVIPIRADLSGADFSGAILCWTDLYGADLSEADFSGADLRGTNFSVADLHGAAFGRAKVGSTTFANVDLSQVKGLEEVMHVGPSNIGIETFYQSNGKIPDIFLRGAGVPEAFITYAHSLLGQALEFYSCFTSYSSKDQEFVAERLHADLRSKGVRCWFAPEDLKIGDRFQERIEESIRLCDKVMIVLSEASVQSRWVEREVNAAREREDRESRTVLFPIRIDDAVMNAMQPWAADLRRTRHIGDFHEWQKHTSYRKAFDRLLSDLQASQASRAAEGQ